MADLQTEIFRKVLPQMRLNELKFDDDVGTTTEIKVETEKATTNQTELLWRYIRDNPGSSASDVTKAKGITDYKNVATRINQLAKRGVLRQDTNEHPIKNYAQVNLHQIASSNPCRYWKHVNCTINSNKYLEVDMQAFPKTPFIELGTPQNGMTLRDYFAAKAMQGLLTAELVGEYSNEHVAEIAYRIADAMIKARAEA